MIPRSLQPVVLAGTNGEAVALTAAENSKLVRLSREIAVRSGRPDLTLVLGCGGQCTRDVIDETRLAKDAGADFALVLVPVISTLRWMSRQLLPSSKRYIAHHNLVWEVTN